MRTVSPYLPLNRPTDVNGFQKPFPNHRISTFDFCGLNLKLWLKRYL